MKHEGMTLEFVRFIDTYKVGKTNDLIKSVKATLKKSVKSLGTEDAKEIERKYTNELEHNDINDTTKQIMQELIVGNSIFFLSENEHDLEDWKHNLLKEHDKWKEYQLSDEYKAQSVKTKILNYIKKSLKNFPKYQDNEKYIIEKIKRANESVKLAYDLKSKLNSIKLFIGDKGIKSIDENYEGWITELDSIAKKYDYANWLDDKSKEASGVTYSTHVQKLTHTKCNGTDICFNTKQEQSNYLTTSTIKNKRFDISGGAQYTPIKNLLNLEFAGTSLAKMLLNDDISFVKCFATNKGQLQTWKAGFLRAFENTKLSTNHLAKQIYFPVKNSYHLISPLASSSLDHAIFERIELSRPYQEKTKEIKNQRFNGLYHSDVDLFYPDIAVLKVTATPKAHPNASPRNQERQGKRYLFTSAPPHWNVRLKPPISQKSLFQGEYDRRAWQLAKELQRYLLALQNKKSNKLIRDNVKDSVNKIIDCLFNYVVQVQALENASGWSEQAEKLKESHKLWLDPYRDDEDFQLNRKRGEWQDEVCRDFGKWMNSKLNHKKMKFSNIEVSHWAKLLKGRLRELELDLEISQ